MNHFIAEKSRCNFFRATEQKYDFEFMIEKVGFFHSNIWMDQIISLINEKSINAIYRRLL